MARGISSVGIDIDPVSCLVAKAKTTPLEPRALRNAFIEIQTALHAYRGRHTEHEDTPGGDIAQDQFDMEINRLWCPPIPSLTHWFRRYVIVDLAVMLQALEESTLTRGQRDFFRTCAAATIRRVSNADPAPVSGLEVTTIQAERNARRCIRVFDAFYEKCRHAISGMEQLWNTVKMYAPRPRTRILRADALEIHELLEAEPLAKDGFPLVITSPPYCRAVEYSRRHQLEMYWLGFVKSPEEHVALTHSYIGRKLVRQKDWQEIDEFGVKDLDRTIRRITERDPHKGRTVQHYFHSLRDVFSMLHPHVRRNGTVVCVIGDSLCCNVQIATTDFVAKLASEHFWLTSRFSYALRNQYMQYGLWNGDGIKEETVLIFKRR